jgi:hypothetical protein
MKPQASDRLYRRIREILESARASVSRSVNTTQVVANWLIGREIVEEEQRGKKRADYGKRLIQTLSVRITKEFGTGYSVQNLFYMKQLYFTFPRLLPQTSILHAVRGGSSGLQTLPENRNTGRSWRTIFEISPR